MQGSAALRVLLSAGNLMGALALAYPFASEDLRTFVIEELPVATAIMAAIFAALCANGILLVWSLWLGTVSRSIRYTLQATNIVAASVCAAGAYAAFSISALYAGIVELCLCMIFIANSLFLWRAGDISRLTKRFRPLAKSDG